MDIVLASANAGKLREFQQMLEGFNLAVIPQSELAIESAAETGLTFVENALIKARHATSIAKRPAIADDSGLEVDYLQGAPGIYSSRFAGDHATDKDNNHCLLQRLEGVAMAERTARYHTVIVYMRHALDPTPLICQAQWKGRIALQPLGDGGFGYDPLFIVDADGRRASELSATVKNRISHRGQAMKQLLDALGNTHLGAIQSS